MAREHAGENGSRSTAKRFNPSYIGYGSRTATSPPQNWRIIMSFNPSYIGYGSRTGSGNIYVDMGVECFNPSYIGYGSRTITTVELVRKLGMFQS